MPAQATAKSVIASAKRAIDMRHRCRNSSRMAEISVPAWPMPIHQTKLTMAKPQPTGMFTPQMPVPFINSTVTAKRNIDITAKAMMKPYSQPGRMPGRSTICEILSVTDVKPCPGSRTWPIDAWRVDAADGRPATCPARSVL